MNSKSLVLIENRSQIDELMSLAKTKQCGDTKLLVIALNRPFSQELARRGMEFKTPEDYGLSEEYLEEESLKWLRAFPSIKVKDNKNIKQLVTYDGISIW